MKHLIKHLRERDFIDAVTHPEIEEWLEGSSRLVYCGFDPTADSLHLGNLVGIIALGWFQRFGHTPVAVVGGATGMIGDPSGRSVERNLLTTEILQQNLKGIRQNIETVLSKGEGPSLLLLNNYEWFKNFSFLDFLRDVGKQFRINTMLAKDSVKGRLENEEGMSYTEFSYQLLQSYDFLYLLEHHNVSIQVGGSDQWGNITAGIDLIHKETSKEAFGLTFPLLTRSDGKKFGKSEKGAIWLSPEKLSPYEFYQYLYRTLDADVIKLMKMLTFMDMSEIYSYEKKMKESDYVVNSAQKRLATEVTELVHGKEGVLKALQVTASVQPGAETNLNGAILEELAKEIPCYVALLSQVVNQKLVDAIVDLKIKESKGEVRRLIQNGGVYLNNQKITDEQYQLQIGDLLEERYILVAFGKKNKILISVQKD